MNSIRKLYDISDGRRDLFHGIIFKLKFALPELFSDSLLLPFILTDQIVIYGLPYAYLSCCCLFFNYPTFDANSFLIYCLKPS